MLFLDVFGPPQLARCRVVSSSDPPPHLGGLVVVDRWHGLGVLGALPKGSAVADPLVNNDYPLVNAHGYGKSVV